MSASRRAAGEASRCSEWRDPYFVETLGLGEDERSSVRRQLREGKEIDPVISHLVGATSGYAYDDLRGQLETYPIPDIRIPDGGGGLLLDIGCSWGRWTIAAARKGWHAIGVDPSLGAVLAARRLAITLGVDADFVVADGRYLPFGTGRFERVYSYSVLQHLTGEDLALVLADVGRVLAGGGVSEIQMANRYGLRSLYHLGKRGFKEGSAFDVRYWTPGEMIEMFSRAIGPTAIESECWFGLGLLESDRAIVNWKGKLLIAASALVKQISRFVPILSATADSLFLSSRK
jgi:SAM-dependent methyltransferase